MFNKSTLTIEFGSKYIKMMQSKLSSKHIIIEKIGTIEIPEGCIVDGYLEDADKVKRELNKVLSKKTYTSKNVICTLKSSSVITRTLNMPKVSEKELGSLLHFEVQEQLPINLDEYILEYKVLGEIEEEGEKYSKVNVILYPKKIAKSYWDLIYALKLKPVALELNSNCVEKLFGSRYIKYKDESYGQDDAFAVVDLGYSYIEINIINNNKVVFSRIIQNGGQQIDEAIISQIFVEDDKLEEMKRSFVDLMKENKETSTQKEMINDIVKTVIDKWIRDIDRVLDYYRNQNREKSLKNVYLHGGCCNVNGIDKYMEYLMNVSVKKIYDIRNIKSFDNKFGKNSEKFINVIGATIRQK